MRRHRRDLAPIAQINLTSLLDVTFVLLIAFIIVAPSLKYGIELDLPTLREGAPQLEQNQTQLFTIAIPKPRNGSVAYYINDQPATLEEIESRLRLQQQQGRHPAVEIEADRDLPYEIFVQVVSAIRRAGIESLALPIEAKPVLPPNSPTAATTGPAPRGQ
ncbi:MAG: ExbD/TolR family protein [Candidatus Sumerlaeaceae bacterium]|jgi:biopolymer transport protein ExbD